MSEKLTIKTDSANKDNLEQVILVVDADLLRATLLLSASSYVYVILRYSRPASIIRVSIPEWERSWYKKNCSRGKKKRRLIMYVEYCQTPNVLLWQ